jgi:hypothetical protein
VLNKNEKKRRKNWKKSKNRDFWRAESLPLIRDRDILMRWPCKCLHLLFRTEVHSFAQQINVRLSREKSKCLHLQPGQPHQIES